MESLRQLLPLLLQGSMFLLVMAVAMQCRWSDFVSLKNPPSTLLKAVVAVNVIVPAVAVIVALVFPLEPAVRAGMLLMAIAPLAPLVPGKALGVGDDRAVILRLYVLLMLLAIVLIPLTVSILDWLFGAEAVAPIGVISKVILISVLLPIALGLALAALAPNLAEKSARIVSLLATIVLAAVILAVLWGTGGKMLELIGNGTLVAFAIVILCAIVGGHLLGGPTWHGRGGLALAAAIRHPGIAAALIGANGIDGPALPAVLLFMFVGVVITALYQIWWRRRQPEGAATPGKAA